MKNCEIRLGPFRFDTQTGTLTDAAGAGVDLRHQSLQVLHELAATPGETVERRDIVARVWDNREGAEEGLIQCIADIRRVLGDTDKTIIRTVPRKGYRLVPTGAAEVKAAPGRIGRRAGALAAAVLLLGLAAGYALIWSGRTPEATSRVVLAVLPFADLGPSGDAPAIGDALGESIITTLARYSEFDVIARQSSFRFRDQTRDLREIGEALSADYIVQGSQSLADGMVRLSVQLVDAGDGTLRMVDAFEVPIGEVLETNDAIAHRIANLVGGSVIEAHARTPRRSGEIDALILGNRAWLLFQSGPSREKWLTALGYVDRSIAEFPEVEWGYVGRALMLRTGVRFGWDLSGPAPVLAEAEAAARKAVELNPQNYMTHYALGRVLMQAGDIEGSIAVLERARHQNPSSAQVLNALAQSYLYAGDSANLEETVARVARIDPLPGVLTLWVRAWAQWQAGDCDAARATVAEVPSAPLEMNKLRAVIHVCTGEVGAAQRDLAAYLKARPDWNVASEVTANAGNWMDDGPRQRWLDALVTAGLAE